MNQSTLYVKYVTTKTCFLHLSSKNKFENLTGKYVKLTYSNGSKSTYFSITSTNSGIDVNHVGINKLYANIVGIEENEQVYLTQIDHLPKITKMTIIPTNKEDYEIMELLAFNVQNTLLEQINVVQSKQHAIIWIGQNISVKVLIDDIYPNSPGVLQFLTEVVIKTPDEYLSSKTENSTEKILNKTEWFIKNFDKFLAIDKLLKQNKKQHAIDNSNIIFRMLPLKSLPSSNSNEYVYNVFTKKHDHLFPEVDSKHTSIIGRLTPILEHNEKEVYVRLCFFEDFSTNFDTTAIRSYELFVSERVTDYFDCDFVTRINFQQIKPSQSMVKEIQIHTKKNYLIDVKEKIKLHLASVVLTPFVLNGNIPFTIEENLDCSLKFVPNYPKYCVVDDDLLRNVEYTLQDEFVNVNDKKSDPDKCDELFLEVSNFGDIVSDILRTFAMDWEKFENILLIGKPGTGKSTLSQYVAKELHKFPYLMYSYTVNCKTIKGKTVESFTKLLTTIMTTLIICQPSLLVIDDLHVLCEHCEGEETPNSVYYNRLGQILHHFLAAAGANNRVAVLATAESVSKLNKNIYQSRGKHLFKNLYDISELSKTDRKILIQSLLGKYEIDDNVDFEDLSRKTEGFVMQDIVDFCNKVIFESLKNPELDDKLQITGEHLSKALKNTCALSLQNVKLHENSTKTFDDIGGLQIVKHVVVESFLWPIKFPSIFGNSPLRLQSGLLLYGAPGTGKTLLAGAAAKHCGLRLISIKGPELLSKYIGASEQAVRDVFEKAQSARPCILFFDEFDSLAPRRGHDNTGVTDRVVNQLLTQLDGVETLVGVCVLAATSRPDLLDPALLRPGRLDRQLLCPLPNKEDRLEILKVLSKNLDMSEQVNLDKVAKLTEGYSGADLQAVLYTAQMASVSYLFDSEETEITTSLIEESHIKEALATTRPSLSQSERRKYERIYSKFEGKTVEDFKTGSKLTLA